MVQQHKGIRLFVGAEAPVGCVRKARLLQSQWNEHTWIRWTAEEKLHLTVLFMGNVPLDALENLINMFRQGYGRIPPISLGRSAWAWGPDRRRARMIWLKYHRNRQFTDLVLQSQEWFGQIMPFPQQRLSPVPHITVARFRPKDTDPSILLPKEEIDGSFIVDRLTLWKSELDQHGGKYTPLTHFPLQKVIR